MDVLKTLVISSVAISAIAFTIHNNDTLNNYSTQYLGEAKEITTQKINSIYSNVNNTLDSVVVPYFETKYNDTRNYIVSLSDTIIEKSKRYGISDDEGVAEEAMYIDNIYYIEYILYINGYPHHVKTRCLGKPKITKHSIEMDFVDGGKYKIILDESDKVIVKKN